MSASQPIPSLDAFQALPMEEQVNTIKRLSMEHKISDIWGHWGFQDSNAYYSFLRKLGIRERVVGDRGPRRKTNILNVLIPKQSNDNHKKSVGIVRTIDDLGRLVLPQEIRDIHGYNQGTPMEIFEDLENERIIFKRYLPIGLCMECQSSEDVVPFKRTFLCKNCMRTFLNIQAEKKISG